MKKKHFFLSDNDNSAAVLPNHETWVGDFGANFSPKVFSSATIKSNQFISAWWPMKWSWSSGTITCNFWNRKRLSVDASRNDAQGEQTVVFEFELVFFASEEWNSQLLCHFCSLKRIENANVNLTLSTNVTILSLEVCVRQTEGPVTVFLLSWSFATSFIWNSGHNFLPRFFFQLWSQFPFNFRIWADQAPGWPGTLFGTAYPEAAW